MVTRSQHRFPVATEVLYVLAFERVAGRTMTQSDNLIVLARATIDRWTGRVVLTLPKPQVQKRYRRLRDDCADDEVDPGNPV
jgi:hypothetical protein